jgi:hypothetical protein
MPRLQRHPKRQVFARLLPRLRATVAAGHYPDLNIVIRQFTADERRSIEFYLTQSLREELEATCQDAHARKRESQQPIVRNLI